MNSIGDSPPSHALLTLVEDCLSPERLSEVCSSVIASIHPHTDGRKGKRIRLRLERLLGGVVSRFLGDVRAELTFVEAKDQPGSDERLCAALERNGSKQLEAIGRHGASMAAERKKVLDSRRNNASHDRTKLTRFWLASVGMHSGFAEALAHAIWRDKIEFEECRGTTPAISARLTEDLHDILWSPKRTVYESPGGGVTIIGARGRCRARLVATHIDAGVASAIASTRSLTCHRLVRWIVHAAAGQYESQFRDFRRIVIEGGFSGLAARLGIPGGRNVAQVHECLEMLQQIILPLPHGELGGLLTWSFQEESAGQRAILSVIVGDPLLPNYVVALPKRTQSQRRARKLVPVPGTLPPLVGRPNEHAAIVALEMLVLHELRIHASDLVEYGAVEIPYTRWREFAEEAGLPPGLLPRVQEAWLARPGFLVRLPNGYTLAPEYGFALESLVEAGEQEILGRRRQRRSRSAERRRQGRGSRGMASGF